MILIVVKTKSPIDRTELKGTDKNIYVLVET